VPARISLSPSSRAWSPGRSDTAVRTDLEISILWVTGQRNSPRVARDTLAGIARDIAGEFALEGRRQREVVQPLHLGAGADQCRIRVGACAVDHEARALCHQLAVSGTFGLG
jgi:hypothetical protein